MNDMECANGSGEKCCDLELLYIVFVCVDVYIPIE